jgi:hypothetical protein
MVTAVPPWLVGVFERAPHRALGVQQRSSSVAVEGAGGAVAIRSAYSGGNWSLPVRGSSTAAFTSQRWCVTNDAGRAAGLFQQGK